MATADLLLELMSSWIEQRECCAKQLRKLAQELESLREKCNGGECIGSSVAVIGAACLIGAGVATVLTAGAAAPFLGVLGATYSGVGVAISVAAKITEHFSSSNTMKEAQNIEEKSNEIAEKIQKLFQQLKAEREEVSSFADPDELDQHVMTEILRAIARRSGLRRQINVHMLSDELQFSFGGGRRYMRLTPNFFRPEVTLGLTVGLVCILRSFTFQLSGKKCKPLFAKGLKQLIKQMSITGVKGAKNLTKLMSTAGFKTAVKGGAMVVGGAVGLAFELPEAIDNWKEMIKNNHVTEASKSLTDTADGIIKTCRTLKKQFSDIKKMFDEMAKTQQEHEEKENDSESEESGQEEEESESESKESGQEEEESESEVEESGQEEEESESEGEESGQEEEESESEGEESSQEEEESESEGEESGQEEEESESEGEESGQEEEESERKGESETNQKPPAAIRVGLLNVWSMNNKPEKILKLITRNNLDVFLPTETWSRRHTGDEVLRKASPENFNSCFQARGGTRRGGGVAIQFLEELQGEQIHLNFITTFEYVVKVLQHDEWDEPIVIINLYLPPGCNKKQFKKFLDEFEMLLKKLLKNYNNLIVTGDFNIKVDPEKRSFRDEFYHVLPLYDLSQHVREPTHNRGNTLDLVITRNVEIFDLFVRNDGISDHFTVYFNARPVSKDTRKKTKENMEQDEQAKRFKKKEE